ncbi:MAG TPA: DUF1003 domain-containing protein [Cryptosporangiaceae bacterium]|nr:DUF1003 domain-containing protein [Cryptosporangiaceae bacterium]
MADFGRAAMTRSRTRLDQPLDGRRRLPRLDPDAFGRFSERIAGFLGTGNFLIGMTIFVIFWISLNVFAASLRWDPYPFILLNLMFSTQASYAAPLILLAQSRQADRDRITLEEDRQRAQAAKADTEYLARELAALRLAIGEVATREYVRSEVNRLLDELRDTNAPAGARSRPPSRKLTATKDR